MDIIKRGEILELNITDLNDEGMGVGRNDSGAVVFVKGAVPCDKVRAEVTRVKKKYMLAKMTEMVKPSELRTVPRCGHFGVCNGCKMQNLEYKEQLRLKRQHVYNAFERIGGFSGPEIPDVLGSENIYFYRNKLEFSFSKNRWLTEGDMETERKTNDSVLGYHMPGFIDKVLDIEKCHLQSELSNRILTLTRNFFKDRNSSIYSFKTHSGYLRYLIVRSSDCTREVLVNLITTNKDSIMKDYADILKKEIPEVSTLTNSISTTKAQAAMAEYYLTIFGKGYIEECIGELKFKISPNMFFQTNSRQTKALFDIVIKLAEFKGREKVLDMYCGAGAIALYVSGHAESVTGVESNKEAVSAARENADLNDVTNCGFIECDVKDYLKKEAVGRFDTIILDPPRGGLHPKAIEYLLKLEPAKIIYVSCNPATQARDLKGLAKKYEITAMQPVDMFPHTMHVENVASLKVQ